MLLPPAPPKEGIFRAFKGGRACASKRDFFLTHALQKKNRLLIANAQKNVKKNFGHLCYSCRIFDVVGERGVWVGICSRWSCPTPPKHGDTASSWQTKLRLGPSAWLQRRRWRTQHECWHAHEAIAKSRLIFQAWCTKIDSLSYLSSSQVVSSRSVQKSIHWVILAQVRLFHPCWWSCTRVILAQVRLFHPCWWSTLLKNKSGFLECGWA